jgi:hypothetical protein
MENIFIYCNLTTFKCDTGKSNQQFYLSNHAFQGNFLHPTALLSTTQKATQPIQRWSYSQTRDHRLLPAVPVINLTPKHSISATLPIK